MLYKLIRPVLFQLEAETAHNWTLNQLDHLPGWLFPNVADKPVQVMGLNFRHPVGIAAGLDKDGQHLKGLAKLHPAFIEIGTVTPLSQPGNDKPRLFRLPKANALINRMGFNNEGVDALIKRLKQTQYDGVLGINIGKNKATPIENASDDYKIAMTKVYPYADYITINISSPNTPDLRKLQGPDFFPDLLKELQNLRESLTESQQKRIPILIKISPDEADESLQQMAKWVCDFEMDGMIATNTTADHQSVESLLNSSMQGGLSGRPLAQKSQHCLSVLRKALGPQKCLISVGGIDSVDIANERLAAGANLLQVYTGLIYQGPGLIKTLVNGLK
ncbi:quinone-dependent dihydroorotate dehydrogenase [Legionella sp. W05-934-2]|uniref:quinone-dependent dihydroorotate dehydrogenase n=1 Tax=Legionella sp. W05-934-2 TaxID=1198649 RepID=UPI003461CA3D